MIAKPTISSLHATSMPHEQAAVSRSVHQGRPAMPRFKTPQDDLGAGYPMDLEPWFLVTTEQLA